MREIICHSEKFGNQIALVDDADYDSLKDRRWYIATLGYSNGLYAATKVNYKHVSMHRLLLSAGKNEMVDHKDGNGLNNQRSNLRKCTRSQNAANSAVARNSTTGYKGVRKHHKSGKFEASIQCNGKRVWIGCTYKTAEEAAIAYNNAAVIQFGEFARLNAVKS